MSGTHGPIEISPLPADGGVVKSSLTYRASPIEISPLPADGGVVKSSLTYRASPIEISPLPADGGVVKSSPTHDTGGWHIGSLRFGSTAIAGTAFTGWT